MFSGFRRLVAALQSLVHALELIAARLERDESGALSERITQLETSRALWEGEMEGAAVKIGAKFRAARAAEQRARALAPKGDPDDEETDAEGGADLEAAREELARAYAGAGNPRGVPTVHADLAGGDPTDDTSRARALKWGGR